MGSSSSYSTEASLTLSSSSSLTLAAMMVFVGAGAGALFGLLQAAYPYQMESNFFWSLFFGFSDIFLSVIELSEITLFK